MLFTYCAYFHLPHFTLVDEEVILHTQAKEITTNPLCSQRR